jgi:hypothetical protein
MGEWMTKAAFFALILAACLSLGQTAEADVTLGSSGNPTVELDNRMTNLFKAEKSSVKAVHSRGLTKLVVAPNAEEAGLYSRDTLNAMPTATGGKQWACLKEALYFEARGETVRGMFGVSEVILNRVDDPRYPDTVCGVVNQGTGAKFRCQFTYTCDGRPENMNDDKAKALVGKVARLMLDGTSRGLTKGATHYHTKSVNPKWAKVFPRTTTIGYHHFYREGSRLASR